jgi:hypothetical protein
MTIKVKKSQVRSCVKNAQITKNQNGMFIPYEFIAFDIEDQKFYSSVLASSNSWTNYPGVKVWNNGGQATEGTKKELVDYIFEEIQVMIKMDQHFDNLNFEFIYN